VTRYLLDTNVVSELRKAKPHGAVLAWVGSLSSTQMYISAATFGELQRGVEITRKQNREKAEEIEAWAAGLQETGNVIPMDATCFREWARLMHGQPDQLLEDAMIAATARVHGLVVATRNTSGFSRLGVSVVDPFRQ